MEVNSRVRIKNKGNYTEEELRRLGVYYIPTIEMLRDRRDIVLKIDAKQRGYGSILWYVCFNELDDRAPYHWLRYSMLVPLKEKGKRF